MKKKNLLILVVSAILALGTGTFSASAASGWATLDGSWVYYDTYGSMATQ